MSNLKNSKMNTSNTQEIEVHKIRINDDVVIVDFTELIIDSETDKEVSKTEATNFQIPFASLLKYVRDNQLNHIYLYAPDELTEVDAESFLREEIYPVVKDYLTENLK